MKIIAAIVATLCALGLAVAMICERYDVTVLSEAQLHDPQFQLAAAVVIAALLVVLESIFVMARKPTQVIEEKPAAPLAAPAPAGRAAIPLPPAAWCTRAGPARSRHRLALWRSLNDDTSSALAAAVCIVFALPVSYLQVRFPSPYSAWVGRAAYLGYALPGIVVALSLVFFGANYVPLLYQTIAMLVFGYTVRFLPQGLGTLRTGLLQISPRLEEASRSLGHSKRWTFWRVTLPLLRPGIWAGAALVFLTTMKELPVTLLLAPTGFTTLAISIWSATSEAFYARASAPALLLVGVSALSIFVVLRQEESR